MFNHAVNLIVDTSTPANSCHVYIGAGQIVNSLWTALDLAEDGFVIQIRRGSLIISEVQPFIIDVSIKIYGETELEYSLRMSKGKPESAKERPILLLNRSYFSSRLPDDLLYSGVNTPRVEYPHTDFCCDEPLKIPPLPRIHVEQHSVFIIEAPAILENMSLSSGQYVILLL
jgi:hypothetical protein